MIQAIDSRQATAKIPLFYKKEVERLMSVLRCGAAERVVTPPLGRNIPQCMSPNLATGVKDDLYTHALAVECEDQAAILISIDTSGLGTAFTDRVREAVSKETGVSPLAIMVSAIHIHTGGPQLMEAFWGQGEDKEVTDLFFERTVAAAIDAYRSRVPVTARFGEGTEDRISFCRNYRMTDGSIQMNPGRKHAHEIVEAVTPIDPTLSVLRFDDMSGKPVAEIVNFACHPDTVGGTEYCADFPGAMRQNLKTVYGNDYTVLFLNGCSGNINHIDAKRLTDPDFRYPKDHYKKMGRILADDVLRLHEELQPMVDTTVSFADRRYEEPRRQPTAEDLKWAAEVLANQSRSKVYRRLAEELNELHAHPRYTETVELQVIRIGEVFVVGFPGEPFSDMGLRLRELVAPRQLMFSELANNELGYFATEPAFSAGVYEAVLPSDPFELDVVDRMIDTAAELVDKV